MANLVKSILPVLVYLLISVISVTCDRFDHAVDMDENYRLLWSISNQDITFEVQARTLGYIGLGFSRDGTIYGADIVIGWVDNAQVHFQVRQNYILFTWVLFTSSSILCFRRLFLFMLNFFLFFFYNQEKSISTFHPHLFL